MSAFDGQQLFLEATQQQPAHQSTATQQPSRKPVDPAVQKRCALRKVQRELDECAANPLEHIQFGYVDGDTPIDSHTAANLQAVFIGPTGTVYEGGVFFLAIRVPLGYPFKPPQIRFATKIYHCNINEIGSLSLDILGERWTPATGVMKALRSIYTLLECANPNDPLNIDAARLYRGDRQMYDANAREWTRMYAS